MAEVKVLTFANEADRDANRNGTPVGVATNHEEFMNLVNSTPHGTLKGYQDDTGTALDFMQAEKIFGVCRAVDLGLYDRKPLLEAELVTHKLGW